MHTIYIKTIIYLHSYIHAYVLCVLTYIHKQTHTYKYTYIYIYTLIYIFIYKYVYIYMCACVYVYVCVRECICSNSSSKFFRTKAANVNIHTNGQKRADPIWAMYQYAR